jgi:hypothetical protein
MIPHMTKKWFNTKNGAFKRTRTLRPPPLKNKSNEWVGTVRTSINFKFVREM